MINYDADDLIKSVDADGIVCGKPVDIAATDSFATELKVPPLHRPDVEVMVETLSVKGNLGGEETVYRATLAQSEVRIGRAGIVLRNLQASSTSKGTATNKLCKLVGQAVVQAYMDLLRSDDPERVAVARSMEI